MDIGTLKIEKTVPRRTEYRRLIESLRVMLAIIAGSMMLGVQPEVQH